jgi:hypothetical protein
MTYTTKRLIIATTGTLLLAGTAHAGDMQSKAEKMQADAVVTQTTTSKVTYFQPEQSDVVLGVVAYDTNGSYTLRGEDGRLYENHVVSEDNLTDVSTDIDVVDTYTFEYNGRTYTNKVTAD